MTNQEYIQLTLKVGTAEASKLDKIVSQLGKIGATLDKMGKTAGKAGKPIEQVTGILNRQKQTLDRLKRAQAGAFNTEKIQHYGRQINKVEANIKRLEGRLATTKGGFLGLGETLGHTIKKVAMWTISTGAIYGTLSALKGGIRTIEMVDSKMVDLQKTFIGTSHELRSLKKDVIEQSVAMGSLIDSSFDAAITLSRMGKTRAEIGSLMTASLLAQNIAEMDAADATKYLNAAVLQFNKMASDSIAILDEWNQLSNTTPALTMDFAQAIENAGSIFHVAGGEIQDLNAYTAALVATMAKGGNQIGQALKTIASYAYRPQTQIKVAQITGIDIKDLEGNLLDIDTLLIRLAARWKTLTEAEREELSQTMAGVRRKAYFLNLMENFDLVLEAHAKQWEAAGSAMRENEIRLNSLRTKITQLEAAFQKIAIQGGDAGLLGFLKHTIDALRYLTEAFANANGSVQTFATIGIPVFLIGVSQMLNRIRKLQVLTSTTLTAFATWTTVIGAAVGAVYLLSKATESQATKLREQRREIEKTIETLRVQRQQQQAIIDQFELYDDLYKTYQRMNAQGKDTTDIQKKLKKVLGEIRDQNPMLVVSIDDLAGSYIRLGNAAETAAGKMAKLSEQQRNEQIRILRLQVEANQSSRENILKGWRPSGGFTTLDESRKQLREKWALEERLGFYAGERQRAKFPSTRINIYKEEIKYLENYYNKEYKKLKTSTGKHKEALNAKLEALNKYLESLRESLALEQQLVSLEKKPSKKMPPPTGSEENLQIIIAATERLEQEKSKLHQEDLRHNERMAVLQGREIEYYDQRIEDLEDTNRLYTEALNLGDALDNTTRQQLQTAKDQNEVQIQRLKNTKEEIKLRNQLKEDKPDRYEKRSERDALRSAVLQKELEGYGERQLLVEEFNLIHEKITDEKERELLLDNLLLRSEQRRLKLQQQFQKSVADTVLNMVQGWTSGQTGKETGGQFAQDIGSTLGLKAGQMLGDQLTGTAGALIGNMILPGAGGILGSFLFGEIGKGLFGWEDKKKTEEEQALDENTRAIRDLTASIDDMNEQYFNAPAGFLMPAAGDSLPSFDQEGMITKSGIAMIHQDEMVVKPSTLQTWVEQSRPVQNFSMAVNLQPGAVQVNNPASNIDVKQAVVDAINEVYANGLQRGVNYSSQY